MKKFLCSLTYSSPSFYDTLDDITTWINHPLRTLTKLFSQGPVIALNKAYLYFARQLPFANVEPKIIIDKCVPCYHEKNPHFKAFKKIIEGGKEFSMPISEKFPIEELKIITLYNNQFKPLVSALLHKDVFKYSGYDTNKISTLDHQILDEYVNEHTNLDGSYRDKWWDLKDCNANLNYEL